MPTASGERKLTHQQACDKIKAAWKEGKKRCTIDGLQYRLRSKTRKVAYTEGGESKLRHEVDIIARRIDSQQVPVFNIPIEKQDITP